MGDYKKGRGAQFNTANSFSKHQYEPDDDLSASYDDDFPAPTVKTQFLLETPKQIISRSTSPDIGFSASINPYQGCEHGCIYCYARPSHEYWGFSAGLDFESKIMVKKNAPDLLEKQFQSRSYKPVVIHFSGNTDCYQPAERTYQLTRRMLALCLHYRNPVSIITKNALILRDLDILKPMAALKLVSVAISITTLTESLRLLMEPRTVTAAQRFKTMHTLHQAGVPVGIMTAPIIPSLNDHEIPKLIEQAAKQGACWAAYTVVRLNGALGPLFTDWLQQAFPDRAERVLNQIADCHGGQLNDSRFKTRVSGEGMYAQHIAQLHRIGCQKYLSGRQAPRLTTNLFRPAGQIGLFE
ncbi:PA0069 family radical SAM protein [Spirosoma sp. HMF4905]|uniref:PA0069 family radical SAM protein n=1 Tax=Spirosoma arboris TaxID=2682092 RepID=A0A7K1SAW1_9BACT|nr:PA0069 family radical SAM protein [Spirosoma arboris]MVM30973.1 PA0069 family radical SAM protein [Spirosoma arboris]